MTIHKSKGLEFETVYLDFEYRMSLSGVKNQQEYNLYYIGITRAKNILYNN